MPTTPRRTGCLDSEVTPDKGIDEQKEKEIDPKSKSLSIIHNKFNQDQEQSQEPEKSNYYPFSESEETIGTN